MLMSVEEIPNDHSPAIMVNESNHRFNSILTDRCKWKHDKFMRALVQCFDHPKFSWKLFLDKLENKSVKLQKQASRNDYMLALERFYNHGTNSRNRIAFDQFESILGSKRS